MSWPTYLAIDRNGFILVADRDNNRIVQLNSLLEYISEIGGIQKPRRILLNEGRRRIMYYVIEKITIVSWFSTFDSVNKGFLLAELTSVCFRSFVTCRNCCINVCSP